MGTKQTLAILVFAITLVQGARMKRLVKKLTDVLQDVAVKGRVNAERLQQKPRAMRKIKEILERIHLDKDDWTPFCEDESKSITTKDENGNYKADPKGYVNHVVYEHPGLFVVKVIEWGSDAKSPIHSHGGSECFVLVLEGKVREIQYTWDREEMIARKDNGEGPLVTDSDEPSKTSVYYPGQVTDIDDFDAVHVVENAARSWALAKKALPRRKRNSVDFIKRAREMTTLHVYVPNYKNPVILKLPSWSSWTQYSEC